MSKLQTEKFTPSYIQCPHCKNSYQLNIEQRKYIEKELMCRCQKIFLAKPVEIPKEKRRYLKKFNLVSCEEINEALEISCSPGGILKNEFIGLLYEHGVLKEISKAAKVKHGKNICSDDVIDLIDSYLIEADD